MAYSYVRYTGNGSTTNYTFAFPYLSQDHVKVRLNGVLTTNYSFLNANTVQLFSAPAAGTIIEVRRETPQNSPIVNFVDGSVLLERDLDLLAQFNLYLSQEATDKAEDSMVLDATNRWDAEDKRIGNLAPAVEDDEAINKGQLGYEYPAVQEVAENIANVNIVASDLGIVTDLAEDLGLITDPVSPSVPSGTSKIATVAENITDVQLVADNITAIQAAPGAATGAAASATAAASSASAASTSATSAASSATSATASATSATSSATSASTSATNAANSATAAGTSATNANTSALDAASSATSAATSATSASSSASAASTSATQAAASAASAAALLDNFDDRYLGPKASAPTVDNDGDPLVVGALYFDTTANRMRTYTSTGWVDASSVAQAALTVYRFTATASQTTFSGASNSGVTLAYIAGGIVVSLNGSVLVGGGDDYTASNGTSVVLTSAAAAGDLLEVYAFSSFSIASVNGSAIVDGTVTTDELSPVLDLGVLS